MVTRERVEAVLERVRPFIQADGGDIQLLDVSIVPLHLLGRSKTLFSGRKFIASMGGELNEQYLKYLEVYSNGGFSFLFY